MFVNTVPVLLCVENDKSTARDIERLHSHLTNLLPYGIQNPGKKPQEFRMLSKEEYQKVIFDFNDTVADYPRETCIHELFEEQVEKTPEKVAVFF